MQGGHRRLGALATIAIAALTAAGCGESVEDAEQALCADLATLRANVATLAELDRESTVEEFQQARANVREAWRSTQESARNLGDDRFEAVEDAWDDFDDTVANVDSDASLEDAFADISEASDAITEAQGKIGSGIDCAGDDEEA